MAEENEKKKPDAVDRMKTTKPDNKQFNQAFEARGKEAENTINTTINNTLSTQKTDLKNAYNQNKTAQNQANKAGQTAYKTAKADVNVQANRNERNLDQFADVRDLNRQAGSQQRLQMNRARQTAVGNVMADQQRALQENARRQELLKTDYQNQVKMAIANRDYKRAAALFDNWQNQNNWLDKNAAILMTYGISAGYRKLYGADQANSIQRYWNGSNPLAAYNTGRISEKTYKNIAGEDAPDKKTFGGGGGGGNPWYDWWKTPEGRLAASGSHQGPSTSSGGGGGTPTNYEPDPEPNS